MKQKPNKIPKARNIMVSAAMFRKAGAHVKTNKAKRKSLKQEFQRNLRNNNDLYLIAY